jgi:hypothetical protein
VPLGDGADDDGPAVGTGVVVGSGLGVGVVSSGLEDVDVLGSGLLAGSELEAGVSSFASVFGSGFAGSVPASRWLTWVTVVPSPPDNA